MTWIDNSSILWAAFYLYRIHDFLWDLCNNGGYDMQHLFFLILVICWCSFFIWRFRLVLCKQIIHDLNKWMQKILHSNTAYFLTYILIFHVEIKKYKLGLNCAKLRLNWASMLRVPQNKICIQIFAIMVVMFCNTYSL